MGLTGPNGALPLHYTQQVIARKTAKQHATSAFLDIFNHRLISLFYLAWEKQHFFASFERNGPEALDNGLTQYLFDLIGLGNSGLRNRLKSVPDAALLFYSGILAQHPRPAISLSGILRDYFRVPVEVEQFRGKWLPVAEDGRSDLASDDSNNQLGFGALAGDAVWNQQACARIKIGPLDHTQFRSFLPGGHAFTELMELATFYVDRSIEFDVQLILLSAEIPACRLEDRSNTAPRLGMSSWMGPGPFASDARDTLLESADMRL
jgi:type VI secretion system protein ImpH